MFMIEYFSKKKHLFLPINCLFLLPLIVEVFHQQLLLLGIQLQRDKIYQRGKEKQMQ